MDLLSMGFDKYKVEGLHNITQKHLKFVPGLAIGIVKPNDIYVHAIGVKSNIQEKKIDAETLFSVSSITKVLTSILVMRLMEEGLIDIEKQVDEYLPDFTFRNPKYGKEITIGHLLSHTSGLDSIFPCFYKRCDETLENHVRNIVRSILHVSKPGELFNYSSVNFNLLGYICERVTAQSYEKLIDSYIAAPLGIKDIYYASREVYENQNVATGHIYKNRRLNPIPGIEYNLPFHPSTQAFMNITTLSKIAQMLLNDGCIGEKEYLRSSSIALMKRKVVQINTSGGDYFGYGLCIKCNDQVIHEGNGLGYYSKLLLVPERKIGIVMLSNSTMYGLSSKITHYIIDNFAEQYTFLRSVRCSDLESKKYCFYNQYYASDASDVLISLYYEGEQMYLDYDDISRKKYSKKILVKQQNGSYSTVLGTELRKIRMYNIGTDGKVGNIVIGTVCFSPFWNSCNSCGDMERYCGNYVGQFESNAEEENVRLFLSENAELVLCKEDGTEYILHKFNNSTYFCSAFGIIEFEENNNFVSAFCIKYMQRFEREVKDGMGVNMLHHIGIVVSNIEEAVKLYKYVTAEKRLSEEVQIVKSQKVKVLLIKTGTGNIELIEPIDKDSTVYHFMLKGGGVHHLCYEVGNLETALDYYKSGAKVIVKPVIGLDEKRICFIYLKKSDLGVRLIELIEKTETDWKNSHADCEAG